LQQNFSIIISMIRYSAILALIMVCGLHIGALADSPVRVRSDGKVIDPTGKIIAVQNTKDPRNTLYEKYYTNMLSDGKPGIESDFYIISDQNAGYIRKEIEPEQPAPMEKTNVPPQKNIKSAANNPAQKKILINSDRNVPVYDNMTGVNSVYGN